MSLSDVSDRPSLISKIKYLSSGKTEDEDKLFFSNIPLFRVPGATQSNITYIERDIEVTDIRGLHRSLSLDGNGFEVIKHGHDVQFAGDKYLDQDWIYSTYYPHVEALVKAHLNAESVVAFDHSVRSSDPSRIKPSNGLRIQKQSTVLHADLSHAGGMERMHFLYGDKVDGMLTRGRFRVVNLWRTIDGAVENWPLAFVHPQSIDRGRDCVEADMVCPHYAGEMLYVRHHVGHRYVYLDNQTPDELWLLKCFDSDPSAEVPYVVHGGVELPGRPAARPRSSIEVRLLVYTADRASCAKGGGADTSSQSKSAALGSRQPWREWIDDPAISDPERPWNSWRYDPQRPGDKPWFDWLEEEHKHINAKRKV